MWSRVQYFARETLVSLRRNILMTVAGVLTVGVSLALFGGVILMSRWVDSGTSQIKGDIKAEIFMNVDATSNQIAEVRAALESDPDVESFEFLDKQAAYEEFKRLFADEQASLVENTRARDLPTSFRIKPDRAEDVPAIQRRYGVEPGVDEVATPDKALEDVLNVTDGIKRLMVVLGAVSLFSSLFLIVNTIRLATFARRREIEVMRLVGASNWFVRVPFMAEGVVQGVLGAVLAFGGVFGFWAFFNSAAFDVRSFRGFVATVGDALGISVLYVLPLGAVVGLIGSMIGLRRFLRT